MLRNGIELTCLDFIPSRAELGSPTQFWLLSTGNQILSFDLLENSGFLWSKDRQLVFKNKKNSQEENLPLNLKEVNILASDSVWKSFEEVQCSSLDKILLQSEKGSF